MQKILRLLLVIGFLTPLYAESNWRVLPIRSQQEYKQGLFGGEGEQHPHSMARCLNHPDYIYLSHDVGGAWRSIDAGESWQKCLDKGLWLPFGQSIQVDPKNPKIVFLVVDNSYNYLAAEFEGLYRSQDGGDNWDLVLPTKTNYNGGAQRAFRQNIAYDPTSCSDNAPATRWYAAFPQNGLFRSDDGGDSWMQVSGLAGHSVVYGVTCHPADGSTVYLCSEDGLFISTSQGADVQKLGDLPGGSVTSIAVNPQQPNDIYVSIRDNGLYKSTNAGENFTLVKQHAAARVVLNHGFPDKLYLIGLNQNSIYSDDGGASWNNFGAVTTFPGLGRETGWRRWIDGDLSGLAPNPNDKDEAVAFSRSTLFKTTTGGSAFNESATGFTGNAWSWWNGAAAFDPLDANRFAFFNNDVGMKITLTGGNYFEENTNPNAWAWYQAGLIGWIGAYAGSFQPLEGSKVIVASVGDYFKTQLMRTSNNGKSWTLVTQGQDQQDMNLFVAFHPNDPNLVYAGNKISHDAGKTFSLINFPSAYAHPTLVGMCQNFPDVIFAMDSERRVILRSQDRGNTWEEYTRPGWRFIRLDNLPTFAADPFDPDKIYTLDKNFDLAMYDGSTWTSLNVLDLADGHSSSNFVRTVTVDPNVPGILYAGMFENGISCIFRSTDAGISWQDISENLPRNGMSAMAVNPHTGELYKGSCIGTWIYPAPYDSKVKNNDVTPKQYQLGQNYPNPFNPHTVFPISMKKSGHVRLDIYNAAGRKVTTLVDEQMSSGSHHVAWSGFDAMGQNVSSGVYFVRMQVDGFSEVRKVLLFQ